MVKDKRNKLAIEYTSDEEVAAKLKKASKKKAKATKLALHGETKLALHEACAAGNAAEVVGLLKKDDDKKDMRDSDGETPLLLAIQAKSEDVVKLLLGGGDDVRYLLVVF